MNGEKGQALPLAILALLIGSLVISPFLGHAAGKLNSSSKYEQGITEMYACEAGIEYAIWNVLSGNLAVTENATEAVPQFTINNKEVDVTIENMGSQIYLVTSTASSSDGHSISLQSYVSCSGVIWTSDGDISGDTTGDVYVDSFVDISAGTTVDGSVYAMGDVTLGISTEVTGDVVANGDLSLSNNAVIGGDISATGALIMDNNSEIGSIEVGGNVYAGGDITLDNNTIIYGSVYTTGNILINGGAIIKGDIFIGSDVASIIISNNGKIEGNIYITGSITTTIQLSNNARINQNVYATGTINSIINEANILGDVYQNYTGAYPPIPDTPVMPDTGGGASIVPGA